MASIPGRTDIFPSYFEINEQCSFKKFKETFPDVFIHVMTHSAVLHHKTLNLKKHVLRPKMPLDLKKNH